MTFAHQLNLWGANADINEGEKTKDGRGYMKILIAEDSALMRRAITSVISKLGHETIEAENGADALAKLRKNSQKVGMVILDWNMPVMDGYQALLKIKADDDFAHLPVLMATSDGAEDDVIKAIQAGATSYLIKPFKPEDLAERIEKILKIS